MEDRATAVEDEAAKRHEIAVEAGLLKGSKSQKSAECDHKPKLMVESINMVIMHHGASQEWT